MVDTSTRIFDPEELKKTNIRQVLDNVTESLQERGYNPVTQLVGYLITNDPAYISNYNNARTLIQTLDRDEILKEVISSYLNNK